MGDYTCQARFRSAGGSTVEAKATISLWHSSPLSVVRTEPDRTRVNIVWRTERMEYNQPFYADCNVSPPPPTPVQYTWYIRGRAYYNGERLMIPKLTEHTAGNYTCQAKFVSTTGSPIEVQESLLVHYSQPVSADIQSGAQFTSPTPSFSTTIAPFHGPQLLVRRVALHLVRSGRCCQPNIPAPETGNNSV
ncbi:unnamed protein product [Schistocephalus solidus]|uniref:Ig-like domain-containing protein n=1 Tax=Schistocephalus solidus TaxID=70667 RepID=A0A183T5D3_SCHSO|nr:unnamed protein product [Schistocephalus solidus]